MVGPVETRQIQVQVWCAGYVEKNDVNDLERERGILFLKVNKNKNKNVIFI